MARIIAFCGYKGCGKSKAAKQLIDSFGFRAHSFAYPLKEMLVKLGLDMRQVWGTEKETPCALLGGKTPRHAMQTLGSEWGRHCIDANIWVRAWQRSLPPNYVDVVVDDLRFPNEVTAIKLVGGHIVQIDRPSIVPDLKHESEQYVATDLGHDEVIVNDGTLAQFQARIVSLHGRLNTETGRPSR